MRSRIWPFLALVLILQQVSDAGRVKRAANTNCQTNPSEMDSENVVDDADTLSMSCNNDAKVVSCIWRHTDPISEKETGSLADPTILCTGGPDDSGKACQSEPRVTFRNTENSCAIDVSNTEPEDTGRWIMTAVTLTNSGSTQDSEKRFEVYTYNRSEVVMIDEDLQPETSIDTSYNWDTREEEWLDGTGGYENVEFSCIAYGGRPIPTIKWYIDNNDNDDLSDDDGDLGHFNVATSSIGSDYDYIENYQSTIDFQIDDKLLEILGPDGYGIDVNPETGSFSFDVTCEITQDNQVTAQETMRIDVARKHDNGQLKGSLIGVIVGVVLAGILLIIAVALLVFAKATSRWCFADDEEPNTKPSGPVRGGRGGAGGGNPQAQVYRDDVPEKKSNSNTNTATRKYSTSSNNSMPKGNKIASAATQQNGEWLPDSRVSAHKGAATPTLAKNLNTTPKSISKSIHSTHTPAGSAAAAAVVPPPVASPASTTSTSSGSSSNGGNLPPPRPPKDGVQYANLDHRAFMQDPRNRVLPDSNLIPVGPGGTTYATVTREVTQSSSRTFGGNQKI